MCLQLLSPVKHVITFCTGLQRKWLQCFLVTGTDKEMRLQVTCSVVDIARCLQYHQYLQYLQYSQYSASHAMSTHYTLVGPLTKASMTCMSESASNHHKGCLEPCQARWTVLGSGDQQWAFMSLSKLCWRMQNCPSHSILLNPDWGWGQASILLMNQTEKCWWVVILRLL